MKSLRMTRSQRKWSKAPLPAFWPEFRSRLVWREVSPSLSCCSLLHASAFFALRWRSCCDAAR